VSARRRVHPVITLSLVALIPALVLAGVWWWADRRADEGSAPDATAVAPPPPAPALPTPLLSFRRAPASLAREISLPAFEQAVADFGATLDATSCVAVALDGVPVGSTGADRAVIPASNQKLVVGAVALEVLGPDTTYTTEVRSPPTQAGVVTGDLYLIGGGDPLLTSGQYPVGDDAYPVTTPTSLDQLADAVVAAGVQRVDGSVIGDGTRYDDEWYAPSWSNDVRGIEAGPYDALVVNDARVTGDPSRASDPAEGAAREFTALLTQRGVTVGGAPAAGVAPPEATTITSVSSAPVSDVVAEMLGTSDDNTAEMLVKELGVAGGGGGTRDAGLAVIHQTLEGWGVPMAGVALADGSGLSNDNRLTCAALLAVLARHEPDDAFGIGLPVAAQSGTLSDLFVDSPVAGRLRGKTGTLGNAPLDADPPGVKSLSGYLPVDGNGTIEYALVLNSAGALTDEAVYLPIWNALATALSTYPQGPTPTELGPR
jgi:serine-type D-Ala-D-Ala carboxypeptidase/endopeptidase (penicillin-binding protein 4)